MKLKKFGFAGILLLACLLVASCDNKDPFAGKTWEGFIFIRTTLEFSTDNSVVVNLGTYEDEKGTYTYDEKAHTLVITLENHDSLEFEYNASEKILALNDQGFHVDYKESK